MFDNLLGDADKMQKDLKEKLGKILISKSQNGIQLEANAAREITNISIDEQYFDASKKEELEDLLLVMVNELNAEITTREAEESSKLLKDMLPPGFGGLF